MRVYLDNCCFNRPFDDQSRVRVHLEAEAKLYIQEHIRGGSLQLVWSYMLDFENGANPFEERRTAIVRWRAVAVADVEESPAVLVKAKGLVEQGLRPPDALHVACAIVAGCTYFLTTDDGVLRRGRDIADIAVVDPITFIREAGL